MESQPVSLAEQQPAASPLPSPRPSPRLPLFFSGRDNATPVPDPQTDQETGAPIPLPASDDAEASGWDSAEQLTGNDDLQPSDDEPSTSTGSSAGERPGLKLGKAATRATAAKAVLIGSGMLHRMATRAETLQREAGLYLADSEDAANIGHPIGDILARRGGVAGKALSPDANDALSAAMGLAGYMSKQIALQMQIAQLQQAQAGVTGPVDA